VCDRFALVINDSLSSNVKKNAYFDGDTVLVQSDNNLQKLQMTFTNGRAKVPLLCRGKQAALLILHQSEQMKMTLQGYGQILGYFCQNDSKSLRPHQVFIIFSNAFNLTFCFYDETRENAREYFCGKRPVGKKNFW